jgi:16S rRNA (guanine(966)-N(2))-methyltransferase RsmD
VFNICQQKTDQAQFLDLFAGSGAMGLEALSRGASRAVFVEEDRGAAICIKENITTLHVEEKSLLISADLFLGLDKLGKQKSSFDLIYVDPPYGNPNFLSKALDKIQKLKLLAQDGTLFIEDSSKDAEIQYESEFLKKTDVRSFGIARLYQFKNPV